MNLLFKEKIKIMDGFESMAKAECLDPEKLMYIVDSIASQSYHVGLMASLPYFNIENEYQLLVKQLMEVKLELKKAKRTIATHRSVNKKLRQAQEEMVKLCY